MLHNVGRDGFESIFAFGGNDITWKILIEAWLWLSKAISKEVYDWQCYSQFEANLWYYWY